jgi:hypothetical protein
MTGLPSHPSPKMLQALMIPADTRCPIRIIEVADSSTAISNAIGGAMLDDSLTVDSGVYRCTLYLNADRNQASYNPRAAILASRLGLRGLDVQTGLRGDVLVTGLQDNEDCDVPTDVADLTRASTLRAQEDEVDPGPQQITTGPARAAEPTTTLTHLS